MPVNGIKIRCELPRRELVHLSARSHPGNPDRQLLRSSRSPLQLLRRWIPEACHMGRNSGPAWTRHRVLVMLAAVVAGAGLAAVVVGVDGDVVASTVSGDAQPKARSAAATNTLSSTATPKPTTSVDATSVPDVDP